MFLFRQQPGFDICDARGARDCLGSTAAVASEHDQATDLKLLQPANASFDTLPEPIAQQDHTSDSIVPGNPNPGRTEGIHLIEQFARRRRAILRSKSRISNAPAAAAYFRSHATSSLDLGAVRCRQVEATALRLLDDYTGQRMVRGALHRASDGKKIILAAV
jgi:hypothetical protein